MSERYIPPGEPFAARVNGVYFGVIYAADQGAAVAEARRAFFAERGRRPASVTATRWADDKPGATQ